MNLRIALCAALAATAACGETEPVNGEVAHEHRIAFAALVGNAPFDCATKYTGIGTTASTLEPLDLKMFVYDPKLVRASGEKVDFELVQDGIWQRDRVALLDFENGQGGCATGSPETRTELVGRAPEADDYVGLTFQIGLPPELNHLDAATAPAPYNVPGMWWSWKGGYKYIRLDVKTRGNAAYYLHLGGSNCTGTPPNSYSCASGNVVTVDLDDFDLEISKVRFDIAELWAQSDLDRQIDRQTDFVEGCMAFDGDPECVPVFERLGLAFGASATVSVSRQQLFTVMNP
jgi:uncharacterized repeat protein (TIGR04052 family)